MNLLSCHPTLLLQPVPNNSNYLMTSVSKAAFICLLTCSLTDSKTSRNSNVTFHTVYYNMGTCIHTCMSLGSGPIQGPIPDTKTPTLSKLEIGLGQDSQPKEDLKVLQQDWMTERVFVQCMGCHFVSKFPEMMYGDKTFMLISCTFLFLHSAKCIDLCCYSGAIM